jgi:hypothetical protein
VTSKAVFEGQKDRGGLGKRNRGVVASEGKASYKVNSFFKLVEMENDSMLI